MSDERQKISFGLECLAEQVYLRLGYEQGHPQMVPLLGDENGRWQVELDLPPGKYRFRYYVEEGSRMTYHAPPLGDGASMEGLDAVLRVEAPYQTAASADV